MPHPLAYSTALASKDTDQEQRSSYFPVFREEGSEHGMLANDAAGLRMIYLASGLTEEEAAPHLEALSTPEALGAALNWYRAAGGHLIADLGPVTVPTLHVWSTEDPALGREGAEATADHVEGPYRFEVFEGVDHWIPDHAPDRLNGAPAGVELVRAAAGRRGRGRRAGRTARRGCGCGAGPGRGSRRGP